MGKVVVTLRVMPKSVKVDLDKVKEELRKVLEGTAIGAMGFKKVPIAFGLTSLEVTFIMPEQEGGTEPVEKAIAGLDDVLSVVPVGLTLV